MSSENNNAGAIALRSWIANNPGSAREFALSAGLPPRSVYQWLSGASTPRVEAAFKIEDVTKGVVSARLWSMRG